MKRHGIMDLFHGNEIQEEEGNWRDIDNELPKIDTKVLVKLEDGSTLFAYFYPDKCQWIQKFGKKPSYFWDVETKEPLFNVVSYKYMKRIDQ